MLSYEQKMRLLSWVRPEKKDELLLRLARGETVDITKDEDLFYAINRDRTSLQEQVERDKYKPIAEHMKQTRQVLEDGGRTKGGTMRYLGDIPADIYFSHPMFSLNLPKQERDANIRKFFKDFPAFSFKGK